MEEILSASDAKVENVIEFSIEELENEVWKDVPGYEGYYQVSDLGRVKSLARRIMYRESISRCQDVSEKILTRTKVKKVKGKRIYYYVKISKGSKWDSVPVHKLSAMAFLEYTPCGYKAVIDHKDNVSTNNRLSNLQITSARHNTSKDRINKTGYTGVSWNSSGKKWAARINKDGFYYSLGLFNTKEEASLRYQEASKNLDSLRRPIKTSKYTGITFNKNSRKWIARPVVNGKQVQIGQANTEEEAYQILVQFKTLLNN